MRIHLKLKATTQPVRTGQDFWWSTILNATREKETFTFKEIDGACDPYHEKPLEHFLRKLEKAGFIARAGKERVWSLVKRQRHCPVLAKDGESRVGARQQNMWNVMRRRRQGFTVDELRIDASTDDAEVTVNTAKRYCKLLANAGILKVQKQGARGAGRQTYVLTGSGNSGPKPPAKMLAKFVYDPNRNVVLGDIDAEEDLT